MLEILNALETLDLLQKLVKVGLISSTPVMQREIFFKVEAHMRLEGASKRVAAKAVADSLNISESSVWAALKIMASPNAQTLQQVV